LSPMDFSMTEEQERFRQEARAWLLENVPSKERGDGPLPSLDTKEGFEAHRSWERRMFDARWSVVSWPERYGGRDAGLFEWLIFEEEYWAAGGPARVGQNGIFLLAPALMTFGTEGQRERFLRPMASGEEVWCQGWSEPDAGSDLASLRSRAKRSPDGESWVLHGQKTWCSRGAFADWIFTLFRTDPEAERHRGLTYFLVPLDSPGVTVRPIRQMDGEPGFAEVFFDEVEVPDSLVLGEPGRGWDVAMATTSSERGLSLRSPGRFSAAAARLLRLFGRVAESDPERAAFHADRVVRAWLGAEAYRLATYATATRIVEGHQLGPESSLAKLAWSETDLAIHEAAMWLLGEEAWLEACAGGESGWLDGYLFSLAGPIYAGTNEIQRNLVAERVLGLPRG